MPTLYNLTRRPEYHENLAGLPKAPRGSLALKWADAVDDWRWITDREELAQLRREDAPLSYTLRGLRNLV